MTLTALFSSVTLTDRTLAWTPFSSALRNGFFGGPAEIVVVTIDLGTDDSWPGSGGVFRKSSSRSSFDRDLFKKITPNPRSKETKP